jgi:hypothetical protein
MPQPNRTVNASHRRDVIFQRAPAHRDPRMRAIPAAEKLDHLVDVIAAEALHIGPDGHLSGRGSR